MGEVLDESDVISNVDCPDSHFSRLGRIRASFPELDPDSGLYLRGRDLFPLPEMEVPVLHDSSLSRGTRQRLSRRAALIERSNQVIRACNDLYGPCKESKSLHAHRPSGPTQAQISVVDHIAEVQRLCGPPPFLPQSQEAVENIRALLGAASPYPGERLPAHMGPYERSLVSRPEAGTRGVVLADVLSVEDSALLGGPSDSILLSADELGAVYDSGIRIVPYGRRFAKRAQ